MKRVIIGLLVIAAAVVVSGCGRSQRTVVVPGGTATVTTHKSLGGKTEAVEVKTKDGKATFTSEKGKPVSEKELGVPVYPGAVSEASGKMEMAPGAAPGTAQGTVEQHTLSTKDSFDKVAGFYKSHIKNPQNSFVQTAGDQKMAMFSLEQGGKTIAVQVMENKKDGKTMISVVKATKQK